MKEIVVVNHMGIRVTTLEKARQFNKHLGFILVAGPIGPEPVAIAKHASAVIISLVSNAVSGIPDNNRADEAGGHPGPRHIAGAIYRSKSPPMTLRCFGGGFGLNNVNVSIA